jgi:AcrR family transcriptional regulator
MPTVAVRRSPLPPARRRSIRSVPISRRNEAEVLEEFEQRARAILGSPETEDEADATDGRVAIRLRNREKIIGALIALIIEGKAGTIDEIVERSGVARRSIFRHFTDLSDLMLSAMRTVVAESAPHAILKDPGVGPLDRRIESFVDARLATLARMHPFRSGANARLAELEAVKVV